ncbi:nuclear polyadenylated RNA-binding protein NAB2 [Plasmodium falciparum NF54]|uniref:Nuclear polyadenylated RNA-binding protein NAB2, putative n=3 Tax=Plasmodium falciparum TaxID=5833 RepID=C6KT67_PLAF7|nr:nuclear polyadenylated RNA-binding protein NAB2, putative [Plasmodium falciparum 3D7]KAF4327719.1 nuclear polyadenylated RNA-binding protein NAB2 [Plasmodium falciparum NF54]PKC42790.1 nuclear polyadenylated RNA-binding protein NAB2 [Plasmodium falciparum NF54]CAG25043.1 nuclear polyadenylated RNA-binding protein NAB2, putative [Plasmodium falciparum 3D7]|eukprot:XP_966213.1 nuclear polyadenylated RNA-binding protein NAB2,putative [Plasmodium falciparum 3D7]
MLTKSKEEQKAYQTIITEKLRELLGEYEVDILTEYVWHMAGNAKSSNEFMCNELKDFLGDHTTVFVDWLMRLMGDIRKQKKSDTSFKNDKSNKSSSVREKQHDEYSKSNRSRDSKNRVSSAHNKKGGEDDFDKRNLSDTRRRSRSLASSKYSNEDMYFSKNRNKRRQKRGLSMRSVSSSSSTRKIHYDKNKSRNKRSDRGKDSDMFRLRDKYRRLGKSHSQSFSPSRVIYVENGQRKEKKNETHHDNVLNVKDITYKRISDSADEYNNSEKKNKAVLKPNPRFVGDNPNPFMQPPTMMNNQEMSSYNMNNMPNFYQGNYVVGSKNMMDNSNNFISNNMNNNFVNSRYQNNIQPKNGKFLQNINNTSVSSSVNFMNTNRFNNNVNNNNYGFQKNNMINNNSNTNVVGTVPMDEQINNTQNFIKQNNNNMRNQQTFFSNTHNENNVNTHQYFTPKGNKQQIFNTNITNIDKQIKTQQQIQQNVNVVLPCDSHNTSNVQSVGEVSNNIQNDHMNDNMLNNALNTNEDGKQLVANQENVVDPSNVIIKIQKKCLYLPNCQFGDKCRYIHPVENCRNWPYCAFGSECIYIHPNVPCKFGIYCTNYYCNYSHDHVDTTNLPEIGTNGYFLNKKLINTADKNITTNNNNNNNSNNNNSNNNNSNNNNSNNDCVNNEETNFKDTVAQISYSMPKTPPEMKKEKNNNEYNENEYLQNLLDTEKGESQHIILNEQNKNDNLLQTISQNQQDNNYQGKIINQSIDQANNIFNNNQNQSGSNNCFQLNIDPDKINQDI